jgi:hypothetical protein
LGLIHEHEIDFAQLDSLDASLSGLVVDCYIFYIVNYKIEIVNLKFNFYAEGIPSEQFQIYAIGIPMEQ